MEQDSHHMYNILPRENHFKKIIEKGIESLEDNMYSGNNFRKSQIPRYYIQKYGVTNLYRMELNRQSRLIYTIVSNNEGLIVIILEIFPDHKSYERRFGY